MSQTASLPTQREDVEEVLSVHRGIKNDLVAGKVVVAWGGFKGEIDM